MCCASWWSCSFLNGYVSSRAERRRDRAEGRATARLLERELQSALAGIRTWCEKTSSTDPSREDVLRFPAWKRYHLWVAARSLPASDWDTVSDAYLLLYAVRTNGEFAGDLGTDALAHLARTDAAITTALDRLHARTQVSPRGGV
jgi:hypothetical protein